MGTENSRMTDKIVEALRKAAVEIEELRVQLALGKAEAADLYEEAKKKLNTSLYQAKVMWSEGKEKADELTAFFEELQLQLSLGKAETKDAFIKQRNNISKAMDDLESRLMANETSRMLYEKIRPELEKFRIKLDILKLRFELGKMEAREDFEEKKAEFLAAISKIEDRLNEAQSPMEKSWDHFKEEVGSAYSHLKKAFSKS